MVSVAINTFDYKGRPLCQFSDQVSSCVKTMLHN